MSFDVNADAYDRFMGRYSEPLAAHFANFAGVRPGQRALDVGCGPGALTAHLVERLGADAVNAVDPSPSFVDAMHTRLPEVDVELATAERLPFDAESFDVVLAQLVVHFMDDAVAGLREMGRVAKPGGAVAACVWDHAGGKGPLSAFWEAVHDVDPNAHDESALAGSREGSLVELCEAAELSVVAETTLTVTRDFATFDEWWELFSLGVGPSGGYVAGLDDDARDALRAACERRLSPVPFTIHASAWAVRARP
jgi:SAM-dependent methyltransferase